MINSSPAFHHENGDYNISYEFFIRIIYLFTVKDCFYKAMMIFSLVLSAHLSHGQNTDQELVFDQLSKKQGLADNFINTIFQDSRGFLWLATNHGLSRYDGRNFRNYNTLGTNGITDKVITCITEDRKGNIWFGTESGLNRLDPFTEKITQYHEGVGPGTIPYNWCNYLFTDRDKNVWVAAEKGVAVYHEGIDSFQNFSIRVYDRDKRINKFIKQIAEGKDGKLWMASSYGVKVFDKKTGTYISYFKEGINSTDMRINMSGSGDLTGKITATSVECSLSGSGDLSISGRAENAKVKLVGSGDLSARELQTVNTYVEVVGSGDASVNATGSLKAKLSGSGDINYRGNPKSVSKSKSGSGDINRG
jgi:hypothetical protein